MTYKDDMKYKFQYPQIKFYWNTATSIHLYIVYYGCFSATTAELSSWDRDHTAPPQSPRWYLLFGPLQKQFANPQL